LDNFVVIEIETDDQLVRVAIIVDQYFRAL